MEIASFRMIIFPQIRGFWSWYNPERITVIRPYLMFGLLDNGYRLPFHDMSVTSGHPPCNVCFPVSVQKQNGTFQNIMLWGQFQCPLEISPVTEPFAEELPPRFPFSFEDPVDIILTLYIAVQNRFGCMVEVILMRLPDVPRLQPLAIRFQFI